MEKHFSTVKYFIHNLKRTVKNENKLLSKKYNPSIREAFSDYIETFNDYQISSEKEKLKYSLDNYIEALSFYVNESIFLQKENELKNDFEFLKNILIKNNTNYKKIEITCSSILKKMQRINIYKIGIDILKEAKVFNEADKITTFFINEFIYDGYSLKFIDEWLNKNILVYSKEFTTHNMDDYLEKIITLKQDKKKFTIYLSLYNKDNLIGEKKIIGSNLELEKKERNLLRENKELTDESLGFLQEAADHNIYKVDILALDYYKGLEILKNSISEYFQLIEYIELNPLNKNISGKFILVKFDDCEEKLDFEKKDEFLLFSGIESREKEDIKDFIKFRDEMLDRGIISENISNIQRALNILRDTKEKSEENRLLNYWSVIEYILTFHEGASIIGKVKDILPKLICLYYIKDKLNNFWFLILQYEKRKNDFPIISKFLNSCAKDDNKLQYDLVKLLNFINNNKQMISELSFNDNLSREFARIGLFISNHENRKEQIEFIHKEVKFDLIRIYRTRNVLIHSGYQTKTHINFKALRLFQYNNQLLGVIIHYKKLNPNITIEEILSSIIQTYEHYIKIIENKTPNSLTEICKPQYLFL